MKKFAQFIVPSFLQRFIWLPTHLFLSVFTNYRVIGKENIANIRDSVIFASNHTSELDPILIAAIFPFLSQHLPLFFVSRSKRQYSSLGIRGLFYGGTLFKFWGAYPVYNGLNDYEKSMRHHIDIAAENGSIVVFPEGGITKDGKIQRARGGVAYLAYRTNKLVVPIQLKGAYKVGFFDLILRRANLSVIIGKPIDVKESLKGTVPIEQFKICAQAIMDSVEKL